MITAADLQRYRQTAGVEALQINCNGCQNLDQLLTSMECFVQEVTPLLR
jgi:hypothetical protein